MMMRKFRLLPSAPPRTAACIAYWSGAAQNPSQYLLIVSRSFSSSPSGRRGIPTQGDLESSKKAFAQRQILDSIRKAEAMERGHEAAAASQVSQPYQQPGGRFNATAEAALNAAASGRDGVMPLGMGNLASGGIGSGGRKIDKWIGQGKKWKDLGSGQKVARVTVQSGRGIFILGGGLLTFILIYALSSELFAKNSPTVIFSDACKRIDSHLGVQQHLLKPYRFHTSSSLLSTSSPSPLNPPTTRGRRSRSVSSRTFKDEATGQEVMLLRFFVEARDKDKDLTLWDRTRREVIDSFVYLGHKIQEGYDWANEQIGNDEQDEVASDTHRRENVVASIDQFETRDQSNPADQSSRTSSLFGKAWNATFGSLVGLAGNGSRALGKMTSRSREPGTWSSGEAHAEMVKDENGTFQYKRFFIDIPSSSASVRERVWIVRKGDEVKR
ncbi:hypothetical protein IE53DRAFT_383293 [Violaceomyces palustris]|uniref:Uncharacterized protein n=1 Tax=Violaceomyces palustris TaxID=1673888 RepID=A0ACD0P878_9BASI|nr:hypothetical protein IE53DRAFT_383293 [Violaceomyces palustris]